MAPEAPDPQSLNSWQDAFQYPIPTVRRVEQELRRDISSNKEKLRALVGTRYRELVGTAETIVAMNTDIQEVEGILSDIGRRCNPRLIERKHAHAQQMKKDATGKDADKHAFGAQLALLHQCTTSIARLLRKRSSLLLVAKILVVSRQLHNKLAKHESTPPFLKNLREQLASLRETLLKRIDKRLASASTTEDGVVESLAAYCLAKSLSSDDAIHHFQQVRLDVIISQLDISSENIPKSLHLFIHTLQTSKILRSRQFTDVLSKLKARPILSDPAVRNLDGLDVEVLGRWVAPEINNFTPWINLSELNRSEGVESIKKWSSEAFERLSEGSDACLARTNDFAGILSLRAETIELWLSSWGSIITHRSEDVLERLRDLFNNHIKRVLITQVQGIDLVTGQISSTIASLKKSEQTPLGRLWDGDLILADYSNGATGFKKTVADRLLGRDEEVSIVLQKYELWLSAIHDISTSIEDLRRLRWTDVLVGGEEDDDEIDVNPRLNEEDPKSLSESLRSAVRKAFDVLQSFFEDAFKTSGSQHRSADAIFLLRLVRLMRRDLPTEFVVHDFVFCKDLVPELQQVLSQDIVTKIDSPSLIKVKAQNLKAVPGRTLWEKDPAIPVQPSPSTFKFLRRLTATMDEKGSDLWDPSTVQALKLELQKRLEWDIKSDLDSLATPSSPTKSSAKPSAAGDQPLDEDESNEGNRNNSLDANNDSKANALRDWTIQLLFDTIYLSNMLGDESRLGSVADNVSKSAELSAEAVKAIKKAASDYWKQTELLFGLLAVR
ncbi:hypothetical protein N7468_000351 [Penicillium chermesinum]|uniref:Conserved oligomeric Golgi complex subunit 1 n=1 Tax=Penicillium chermesinum TaxID=63820 RepID=A0A9W9TZ75_9EURO|nr:uncharacterized protein N7468_000351 [Penicillium chermesinum]KAJ5248900.1 hypothetical protein N7468_000351 [Penicillium chermesinum]KAJ6151001.1 hypothetical protein N7470_007595 [Penicillium chermesinum]